MLRMEIHPGEGGADAAAFAGELAAAVAKHAGTQAHFEGGAFLLHRL
jgi:protein subunit release factor A